MISFVFACLLGQCGQVRAATTSQYTYYPTQQYGYTYQQPYYPQQQQVITKYVAVEPYVNYVELAGDYVRAERRRLDDERARDQVVAALKDLKQTILTVSTTTTTQAPPSPVALPLPSAQQPRYEALPAPQGPSKPLPQQAPPYAYPQAPGKAPVPPSPDPFGAVPAPPLVPRGDGIPAAFDKCMACHTAGSERGGFVLFQAPGVLRSLDSTDLELINEQVSSGRMPKRPEEPLTAPELAELLGYLAHGPTRRAYARSNSWGY